MLWFDGDTMEFNLEALVVFKLMNGEVIVCEVVEEESHQITVRYAIQALETIINGEVPNVNFIQWIPFTDDLIIIYRHGILACAPPSDELKELYLNKMAELETPDQELTSNPVTPSFRHLCRHGVHGT
jgi:hypothetical protein